MKKILIYLVKKLIKKKKHTKSFNDADNWCKKNKDKSPFIIILEYDNTSATVKY